jgi:predicted HTH transcriptional regulator
MGDLYFDDIEDGSYTDEMILSDLEAVVKSGQREGSVIDYKSDVSEQDNWPQTVAAFANSFGGLIVFGARTTNHAGSPALIQRA